MEKIVITMAAIAAAFTMVSCNKEDDETMKTEVVMVNGHPAVDMGDGLLWATCNIGAESETDYGTYFSWGETSAKARYFQNDYKFGTLDPKAPDDYGMQKYNTQDKLTRLLPEDDAATSQWGESWRTPTSDEFRGLLDTASYEVKWTSRNGKDGKAIYGLEITNNQSKNCIFLPAAGRFDQKKLELQGEMLAYWSSSLPREGSAYYDAPTSRTLPCYADILAFTDDEACVFQLFRYVGLSIRPVAQPIQ